MSIEIKVPVLPESVSEATLLSWHVKVGDTVQQGQNIIDIETDKVVLELPAPESGVITEILANDGDVVSASQVIAKLDTKKTATAQKENAQPFSQTDKQILAKQQDSQINTKVIMPAAEKLAKEKNINVDTIQGSGRGGRILKEDVSAIDKQTSQQVFSTNNAPSSRATEQTFDRIEKRIPMTRLRQRVAERLVQSQSENAVLSTFNEINMKPVMDLRKQYKDKFQQLHGTKLGFMSFFVKAVVVALKKYPVVNASIDGQDIIYHGYFDIGIAVSTPRGLVVPILRNADTLSMADIEEKISDFALRAQDGKLALEEISGGTFSITNGGIFGSMMSTPIINPPQSAILGMHAIYDRPVVEHGQIVIRPMMYVTLSYDHRLIDGKEAVLTLVTIKQILEDPARLVLEV